MLTNKIKTALINLPLYVLIGMLLVYCQLSNAEDLYTLEASSSRTSDNIDMNTTRFSYINNRREHFWPYVDSSSSNWDWGIDLHRYDGKADGTDFTGHHLEGIIGWNYSTQSYLSGRVGIHQLDVPDQQSNKNKKDMTTYDLYGQLALTNTINLFINIAEDYVYQLGLQPASTREYLSAEMGELGFKWKLDERVRFSGASSKWNLSDNNIKRENKASLVYGISPGWPWIWIGISYEKLKYENAKPDYWTPENFRSIGLIFESSFPITEDLSGALSGSLTKTKEDNNPEGSGGSIIVGFDYKITKTNTLRFQFNRIESSQESSEWTQNTSSLSLNGSF